eukprot:CAMPEP_0116854142 /NCGR_PEP_ID=MMETSP0418-20121206/18397_1 /TAXON_ID=1158023 /ORGANISM="Astrosyne radiata, Strain 13vi08-1A" /LENGTH=113 /DNA_ID=CAMNT_0004486809 /DNA_START=1 /DNA_END=339 /DNA_ORIENTATION=+
MGNQCTSPRFDLEWSAGIRFVKEGGKLRDGTATDFGAHLMQTTPLLERFMGAESNPDDPLRVQVRLTLHPLSTMDEKSTSTPGGDVERKQQRQQDGIPPFADIFSGRGVLPLS